MTEQEECSVCCACRRLRRAVGVGADREDGGLMIGAGHGDGAGGVLCMLCLSEAETRCRCWCRSRGWWSDDRSRTR